ncbi:hypothetical protein HDU81_008083 [Chytriomyces hyalinus]|nr:hypothetical protein HDU81_008083 [Chytriomyces hyalinus]
MLADPPPTSTTSLVVGVLICILMNACSSFGVNLQALGLRKVSTEQQQPLVFDNAETDLDSAEENTPLLIRSSTGIERIRQWVGDHLWHIGFICYIIPQLFGSIIALNFISPILLAPLGSSGLLFNVFFSSLLIGTKVGVWDWVATGLIIAGGTVVSVFGNVDVLIKDFPTLMKTMASTLFIVYFSVIGILLIFCFGLALTLEIRKSKMLSVVLGSDEDVQHQSVQYEEGRLEDAESDEAAMQRAEGLSHPGTGAVNGRVADATKFDNHIGFLFASAGGISASMTLALVKCGLNLLAMSDDLSSEEIVTSIALFVCLAVSVVLQLVTLNKAIVFISPLIAIPVFYTFFTTLSVSNTLVVVYSIPDLELPDEIGFTIQMAILGVSVIVGGVWVLSYSSFVGDKK